MKHEGDHVLYVHVTYVPVLETLGEAKTKPTQHSVKLLREIGIQADFIIARTEIPLDNVRKEKISLFCNIHDEDVISDSNVENVYGVTLLFEEQELCKKILRKLHLRKEEHDLKAWKNFLTKIKKLDNNIPFVLLTDTKDSDVIIKAINLGVTCFINKDNKRLSSELKKCIMNSIKDYNTKKQIHS